MVSPGIQENLVGTAWMDFRDSREWKEHLDLMDRKVDTVGYTDTRFCFVVLHGIL